MKTRIAQVIKLFGIMALVAAFAAAAFPAPSFAAGRVGGSADYGKAVISVVAAQSGPSATLQPVAGATLELINSTGVAVSKYATGNDGKVNLGLSGGTYKIRVSADGFDAAGDYLAIENGQTSYVTVELYPAK